VALLLRAAVKTRTTLQKKKKEKAEMILSSINYLWEFVVPPVPNESYLKV